MSVLEFLLIALAALAASVLGFGFYQISRGSYDDARTRAGATGKPYDAVGRGLTERMAPDESTPADRYGFRHMGHCLPWW